LGFTHRWAGLTPPGGFVRLELDGGDDVVWRGIPKDIKKRKETNEDDNRKKQKTKKRFDSSSACRRVGVASARRIDRVAL